MLDVPITAAGYVNCMADCQEFLIFRAVYFIAEFKRARLCFKYACPNDEEFVVAGGMLISAVYVGDDDISVIVELHPFIVEAEGTH